MAFNIKGVDKNAISFDFADNLNPKFILRNANAFMFS